MRIESEDESYKTIAPDSPYNNGPEWMRINRYVKYSQSLEYITGMEDNELRRNKHNNKYRYYYRISNGEANGPFYSRKELSDALDIDVWKVEYALYQGKSIGDIEVWREKNV